MRVTNGIETKIHFTAHHETSASIVSVYVWLIIVARRILFSLVLFERIDAKPFCFAKLLK